MNALLLAPPLALLMLRAATTRCIAVSASLALALQARKCSVVIALSSR
jgi:hypothetical protein